MEGDRRMCQNTSFRLGGSRAKMGRQSPDTALPVCKSPGIFKKNAPPRRTPVFDLVSSIVRVTNVSPRLVGNDSERGDKSPPVEGLKTPPPPPSVEGDVESWRLLKIARESGEKELWKLYGVWKAHCSEWARQLSAAACSNLSSSRKQPNSGLFV